MDTETEFEFGKIVRPTHDIDLEELNGLIDKFDYLDYVPDRKGTNPFTNEETLFPGKGKAHFIVNGEIVGNLSIEDGVILTSWVPYNICNDLANLLDAKLVEDDER